MANRRLPMRKIKEVLRLKYECGISERGIARSCQISRSTLADYFRRATISWLKWSEAAALTEYLTSWLPVSLIEVHTHQPCLLLLGRFSPLAHLNQI